jgi:hypothetical protein
MLGLHLLNYDQPLIDFARGVQLIKMVNPDTTSAIKLREVSPKAIIILRIHSLSEQHDLSDPQALGIRHADEICARAREIGATHVEGINEDNTNVSQERRWQLSAYYAAFAKRAHELGFCAVLGNIGQGQPEIINWQDYHEMISAMHIDPDPRKSDFLGLHEYWQFHGPGEGWSWLAGRFIRCPFQVPIVITECGIDLGASCPGVELYGGQVMPQHGWKTCVSPETYVAQLAEYIRLCSSDPRFAGATPFTFGGGSGWDDFDVTPILEQLRPLMMRELNPINIPGKIIRVKMASGEIVSLALEEYLQGVVPAEVYPSWHMNALRSQAVLARSYAMWRMQHPRTTTFDLYDGAGDQVYNPTRINSRTDKAVVETSGIYLVDNSGQPYLAQYVSKCGRNDCEYCSGINGYDNKIWNGRACQYGLQALAKTGWNWRDIVKFYYENVKLNDE